MVLQAGSRSYTVSGGHSNTLTKTPIDTQVLHHQVMCMCNDVNTTFHMFTIIRFSNAWETKYLTLESFTVSL